MADFTGISWTPRMYNMSNPDPAFADAYSRGIQSAQAVLESMLQEIDEYWNESKQELSGDAVTIVENLCNLDK